MKKKENTNEDKENIRVLNLQVEHLKKQLFSYKISELKQHWLNNKETDNSVSFYIISEKLT